MISGPEITLVKPRLDLADDIKEAQVESYADHIKYLLWPEPDPSRDPYG